METFIDVRNEIQGFDVTGLIDASIEALFPFRGEPNDIRVNFVPCTIMNQADEINELVLTAPEGYVFPENCTYLWEMMNLPVRGGGGFGSEAYDADAVVFPPPGTLCKGEENVLIISLASGYGLITPNNYTLTVRVTNPILEGNQTRWSFITRVNPPETEDEDEDGEERKIKIVDKNPFIDGFDLETLEEPDLNEDAAPPRLRLLTSLPLLLSLALAAWPAHAPAVESALFAQASVP